MRIHSFNRYLVIAIIAVLLYSVLLYSGTVYLQDSISEGLAKSTGATEQVVELRPKLPLGLLTGAFSTARIVLHKAVLGPITADTVILNGEQVDVSMSRLISGQPFAFDRVDAMDARVDFSEENLNVYFDRFSFASEIVTVKIAPDSFQFAGVIPIVGRRLNVSLHGNLEVLPENKLRIIPVRLVVQNAEIPPVLMEELLREYLIIPIDFSSLPVPLRLSEVQLGEGEVSVYARTQ